MTTCCVAYTSDQNYLFPTLVSAMQARRHASKSKADVVIFGFDLDTQAQDIFSDICQMEGLQFRSLQTDVLDNAPAMMARLFLDRFMSEEHRHCLYLDGDTQITSSLDPLLDMPVPDGHFLAANDPLTFLLPEKHGLGREFGRHTKMLGLSPRQASSYFNTGALRINRNGWDEIGQAAWRLAQQKSSVFRFPDQDPLNVVGADCHLPMSLGWNFPIFMCNVRVEATIRPCIYHFMSKPKPWQGDFMPWGRAALTPYRDAVQRHPALSRYNTSFSAGMRLRYRLQQRYKRTVEGLTWGLTQRRHRILEYEALLGPASGLPQKSLPG